MDELALRLREVKKKMSYLEKIYYSRDDDRYSFMKDGVKYYWIEVDIMP